MVFIKNNMENNQETALLAELENLGKVEQLANGYYYVNGQDAYYMIDPNCDLDNINMFVGYSGLGGYGSGGKIVDGKFSGKASQYPYGNLDPHDARIYWENMNEENPDKLYDAYVLPKNKNNPSIGTNFANSISSSGGHVGNAAYYGFSSGDVINFKAASDFHSAYPDASMQVIIGDNDQLYRNTSAMGSCSNLNDDNVRIYALGHKDSTNGWGVAEYISAQGYDNVYEIKTDNNIHNYTHYDLNSGLSACLSGIIPASMVPEETTNPNVSLANWEFQKWENGQRVGDVLSLNTYATQMGLSTLPHTIDNGDLVNISASDIKFNYDGAVGNLPSRDNLLVYKGELSAFLSSSMLAALSTDASDSSRLINLINNFISNGILRGESWNIAYEKLGIYNEKLNARIAAANELGETLRSFVSALLGCMTDYDMIDTSKLEELRQQVIELERLITELYTQLYKDETYTDDKGNSCTRTVKDEGVQRQINMLEEEKREIEKYIAAIEKLQATYDGVKPILEAALAKVSAFSNDIASIIPSPSYVYTA